jgi:hypothetical protein
MNKELYFLEHIGLIGDVPSEKPARRTVLARSVCPLHDGADNPNAFLVFADGFVCTTGGCHGQRGLGSNLPGLIRHLVWRLTAREMAWREAWRWANNHVNDLRELVGEKVRHARAKGGRRAVNYTAEELTACLQVPDPFYLSRGYQPETLRHFGVGKCVRRLPDDEKNYRSGWSVFPVLEWDWYTGLTLVGYTARNPRWTKGGTAAKWHHALPVSEHLYNQWGITRCCRPSFFICEGPGCVMRLWEAGFPYAVATFGAKLLSTQRGGLFGHIDDRDVTVYIAADNDETGRLFAADVYRQVEGVCIREPVVLFPPAGFKDVGDMPASDLREWLLCEVKADPGRLTYRI